MSAGSGAIRAGRAYVELGTRDSMSDGLTRAERRLKAFAATASHIGRQLLTAGALTAIPIGLSAVDFAKFEHEMAMVSTLLDEPAKHMAKFQDGIKGMAVEFGQSTDELSKALYQILSSGLPVNHSLDVLRVSAKAAAAGLTDTKTSADAITTVLRAYDLSADHAAEVSDKLFKIAILGKTNFAELAPNIGTVATLASTAGVKFDELGAAVVAMTQRGIGIEHAMTSVNAIISGFLKPSDEAISVAKGLGFEMNSTTLKTQGLGDVFRKIAKLPPDTIAKLFPNIRAIKGLLPALQNVDAFMATVKEMETSAGSTEGAYKKMAATLEHEWGQIREQAVAVKREIGAALAVPLRVAAVAIGQLSGPLTKWIAENKGVVLSVAAIAVALIAAGAGIVAAGVAASALASVFTLLSMAFSAVTTVGPMVAAAFGMVASPVGLLIGLIVALAGIIAYESGAIGASLDWLKSQFAGLAASVGQVMGEVSAAIAAGDTERAVKILWAGIKLWWAQGVETVLNMWDKFAENIVDPIHSAFNTIQKAWVVLRQSLAAGIATLTGMLQIMGEAVGVDLGFDNGSGAIMQKLLADADREQRQIDEGRRQWQTENRRSRRQAAADRAAAVSGARSGLDSAINGKVVGPSGMEGDGMSAADHEARMRALGDKNYGGGPVAPDLSHVNAAMAGLSQGTFSANTASRFGQFSANHAERTAKATEKSADLLARILRQNQNNQGGLEFA